MSKLTDIKRRIDQLDGGAFHNLCDAYLCCIGYGTGYSLGMDTGSDKTAKGDPDTYFLTTNNKYVFAMYYQKRPELFEQTYSAFVSRFGVDKDSSLYEYYTQKIVVERLCAVMDKRPCEEILLLFVRVAEQY